MTGAAAGWRRSALVALSILAACSRGGDDAAPVPEAVIGPETAESTTPARVTPHAEPDGAPAARSIDDGPATRDADTTEDEPPTLVRSPVEESWTVEHVRNVPNRGEVAVDAFVPVGTGPWPGLVLFGAAGQDRAEYRELSIALASQGLVVVVGSYDPARPPDQTECVVDALVGASEALGINRDRIAAVGVGLGAAVALGESLGGPWTQWSKGPCERSLGVFEPGRVVLVAPELDPLLGADQADRSVWGLSPLDQLGGNPYVDITVLDRVDGSRPSTTALVSALEAEEYVVSLRPLDVRHEEMGVENPTAVDDLARAISTALTDE